MTIDALLRRERNENVHTEHVARLAMGLFDAAAPCLGLAPAGRRLLEAAARLHDVGFASSPGDHAGRSARIVLKTPLRGFSTHERNLIAGILLLHTGDMREPSRTKIVRHNGPDPLLIRKLGALLRVADALDHGHIQDAEIIGIRCIGDRIHLRVRSPAFPANLEAACRKSDLWNEVLELPLRLEGSGKPVPISPLRADESWHESLRKLLFMEYRVLSSLARGAADRPPTREEIHCARVALRRSALLMRFFASQLKDTRADRLRRALQRLSVSLSPARDATVWNERLESKRVRRAMRGTAGWRAFVAEEHAREREMYAALEGIWQRPAWKKERQSFARFLRVELPLLKPHAAAPAAVIHAVKTGCRKLPRRCTTSLLVDPTKAHALRRRMRRIRYLAELFAPVLHKKFRRRGRALHRLEARLGRLHDLDVAVARLSRDKRPAAARLAVVLSRHRRKLASKFASGG